MQAIRVSGYVVALFVAAGIALTQTPAMANGDESTHRIAFNVTEENALSRADACAHRLIFVNGQYLRADLTDPRCLTSAEYKRRTDLPLSAFDRGMIAAN